ncbi:hypothetical protein RI129_010105 [Pyrocoelia pectoralis]|uniref:Reverse transcriptase domain-containing protein n=1 Tax=Pyrocoelia pectoralis TaxID=417401 RepID=A0AAN7ZJN3_9COLE
MNPVCPKLYGLPKIHKTNVPIRPVVSFTDTPVARITVWLNSILKQLIKFNHNFSITNSSHLTKSIESLKLPFHFSMVSFDVSNLFPSIPPNEVIDLVSEHLVSTNLSDPQLTCIISLLRHCTHFKFQNKFYSQY